MKQYIAVFAVLFALAGCQSKSTNTSAKPDASKPKQEEKAEAVWLSASMQHTVKAHIASGLKDPYSAIFGPMTASQDPSGKQYRICGFVNAKNSFGGYVGMRPYQILYNVDSKHIAHSQVAENKPTINFILNTCKIMGVPGY